eukprot:jgi/Botrbrau1/17117/Bobra.0157s0019.1
MKYWRLANQCRVWKYFIVLLFALGYVSSEDSEPGPGIDTVAAKPQFQMPNIQRIEISTPEFSENPAENEGPMDTAMQSNAADPGESRPSEPLEDKAQSPVPTSNAGPFSDIYHMPDQVVVNQGGHPQFAPSPYAPATTPHTWSGPAASAEAKAAQFEAYSASIKGYSKQVAKSGKTLGQGTLQIRSQNGTLVYQAPFSAPLVPRPVLQQKLDVQKIIASGQYTTEQEFYDFLKAYGVTSVAKVQLIYVDMAGLPGYTAVLLACKYKIPTRTWAYAVTYKNDPYTMAFVFRGTDMSVSQNIVTDLCFGPVLLNTTTRNACQGSLGWPCIVAKGFQMAFDSVREKLVPAWRNITAAGPTAVPTNIQCLGYSLGAAMANLCSVYMRQLFPTVPIVFQGFGNPLLGNEQFHRYFQSSVVGSTLVTHSCDPVPSYPPVLIAGYVPLQDPIWVFQTNPFDKATYTAFAVQRPILGIYLNVNQHFVEPYMNATTIALNNAPP